MSHHKQVVKGIKTVLLGQSSVGKTSLASRFRGSNFKFCTESTIGACFNNININGNRYDIWDTAGQERYLSLVSIYYRGVDIALLVFDVSFLDTLERVELYLNKLIENVTRKYYCIVIGNKIDRITEDELLEVKSKVEMRLKNYDEVLPNPIKYIYTSAKSNENIDNLMDEMGKMGKTILVQNRDEFIQDGIILENVSKLYNNVLNDCKC